MISLRNFTYNDISILQMHGYEHYSCDDLRTLIDTWNGKVYENAYFEMFAIENDTDIVGFASLLQRSKSIISFGIEIYPNFRRKGYATSAYGQMLAIAKDRGYKIAVAQVSAENTASIALNKKLGFEAENYEYVNQKGKKVYYFIKAL